MRLSEFVLASWWEAVVLPTGGWVLSLLGAEPCQRVCLSGSQCSGILNSPPADECGWISTLVVWPEVCQHWSLVQLRGMKSWWENGGLQEGLGQWVLPRTAATTVLCPQWTAATPASTGDLQFSQASLAQALMIGRFPLGPWWAWDPVCTLKE